MTSGRFAFFTDASLGLEGPEAQTMWDLGCHGVEERGGEIVGYFDEQVNIPLSGRWEVLDDIDYLERYYRDLDAIDLGELIIAPTHRTVQVRAAQKLLWIDPGMAFGTGHHETTRMALKALIDFEVRGRSVLDLGSGSGILAIAADLLGAAGSTGLDIDEVTISVARENADLNRSRAVFSFGTLDASTPEVDLMVANLYAELHVMLADDYLRVVRPGGTILLTGIIRDRVRLVEEAIGSRFQVLEWREDGEWSLVAARRR